MTWCSGFVDGFTVNHKDGDFKIIEPIIWNGFLAQITSETG